MRRMILMCMLATTPGAWRQPPDVRIQIRALVDAGQLGEAERMARGGGVVLASLLGDILVERGKLAEADSAYQVALNADATARRSAEAALAELALERGNRNDALRRAETLASEYERTSSQFSADDHVAAGRAFVILGSRTPDAARSALRAFDDAVAHDARNVDARLRIGSLFLDRYNSPDAKAAFNEVLKQQPRNARALLGLSRVADFEGKDDAMGLVRASLAENPSLVGAHVLLARFHLEAEHYDSSSAEARAALGINASSMAAWSLLGATALLAGDSAQYAAALAAARRLNPRPAAFFAEIADAVVKQRRYGDAVRFAREALALDSTSVRALGVLGTTELRSGNLDAGRATLEKAFALDPFNLWHKNTLDLLDEMRGFRTVDRGRFRFVAPPKEAEALLPSLAPLLEAAFDTLARLYQYVPPVPVRLEIYSRHADFSVRTVGLAGLGALGVSFGPVLAMDAPSARDRGDFNWGSTAWHELTHTFTLGSSGNRAPRWLSEGLSVLEERRARSEWGAGVTVEFLAAYLGGRIRPVSRLNDGFVRPRYEGETIFSYYDASLVCEMIEQQNGMSAIVAMLQAYRDGLETSVVFARVLRSTPEQMDVRFDAWLRAKFSVAMKSIAASDEKGSTGGAFVSAVRAGADMLARQQPDSARETLLRAQAMFPEYASSGAPALLLAAIARDKGDLRGALEQIVRVTQHDETSLEANLLEADLREKLGDVAGAMIPLQRTTWIWPYDVGVHARLAELAARIGDHAVAVSERRTVLALNPTDALEARYQLARALAEAGDTAGARTEVLRVLEAAPSFERAQSLLLDLRTAPTPDHQEDSA